MAILISSSSGQVGKVDPLTGTFTSVGSGPSFTDIASSNDGKLFGVTFDQLYSIDPNSGSSSLIGSFGTDVQINALGFFANKALYAAGGSNLYTIDPNTGTASLVANLINQILLTAINRLISGISTLYYHFYPKLRGLKKSLGQFL